MNLLSEDFALFRYADGTVAEIVIFRRHRGDRNKKRTDDEKSLSHIWNKLWSKSMKNAAVLPLISFFFRSKIGRMNKLAFYMKNYDESTPM